MRFTASRLGMLPAGMLTALTLATGFAADADAKVSPIKFGPASVSRKLAATAPAVPTGLKVVSVGDKKVELDWADNKDAFGKYQVYRNDVLIANGPTVSNYVDTGLTNGTSYTYRVSAGTTGAYSAWTAPVTATPKLVAPAVPTGLKVASVGDGTVKLDWADNADDFTKYQVYQNDVLIADGPTASEYTVAGLTNGKSYTFRVSAGSTGRYSAWTATVSATPVAPAPAAAPAPAPAPAPAAPTTTAPQGTTVFEDAFNHGDTCAAFKTAGWAQCHQAYEDRLTIGPVAGRTAAIMHVADGDVAPLTPTVNPRAQLNSPIISHEGETQLITWGSWIGADFPTSPSWSVFAQWFASPYNGSPRMSFGVKGGRIGLDRDADYSYDRIWSMPVVKEQWIDFALKVKWSSNASVGWIELTVNGQQQKFANGQTRMYLATIKSDQGGKVETILTNYRVKGSAAWATIAHSHLRVANL